ncbi:deoxyribonuclease NucA/NucB [Krasilnikovia cinnamomea]|uniref:Deoxyribonuclease NucA/NucB n=1 Tax=Krasilnikovia cinnamomea TaxID=349313 RepID=A0A4Q7ZTF7_9ACTN|nr:hypothetical protein [Krasilnikovia cinnamomea]RZU53863.1 deoxyribonuclease NucA/NucB [Krasilnikovia cinnamomea]
MYLRARPRILVASLLMTAATIAATPPAAAAPPDAGPAHAATPDAMAKPAHMPIARPGADAARTPSGLTQRTCAPTSNTRSVCLTPGRPSRRPASSALAPVPFPAWCADSDGGVPVAATRTAACRITGLVLTTWETVNGTTRVTGELNMDVYDYTYSSVDLPNWIHQIGLSPWSGWGAAVNSTVTGTLAAAGDCVVNGASSFPVQSLSPANNVTRSGDAGARTTATAVGAIGYCTTTWNLRLVPAGYPAATASSAMAEISCDNAVPANGSRPMRVGCVVPWFPAQVLYSQSRYPSLASHVSRAQGSGLPGRTFNDPLTRNVDQATIDLNRSRACGDAPSISGKSCDEYPLASTHQGLAFGGSRRTFSGCNINAPTNVTGPTGASACMITASENNAQGGLMAAFYYDYRVLGNDPFRVGIGS